MKKRVIGVCRVSSKQQEEEGVSIEVQDRTIRRFADKSDFIVEKMVCLSETAKTGAHRRGFDQVLSTAKADAARIHALVFTSVDRATRNLQDLARLENLLINHGIDTIFVEGNLRMSNIDQSTMIGVNSMLARGENIKYGRRVAQSRRDLLAKGRMGHRAPFGYQNYRIGSQAKVRPHPDHSWKVLRIFEIYTTENLTIRQLIKRLRSEGITYSDRYPNFNSSKLHKILQDRTYIGELPSKHGWFPGVHEPLVDEATFLRAASRLGQQHYRKHENYLAGLIKCGHCGRAITTERIRRKDRHYAYYRCSDYNGPGHPRVRLNEARVEQAIEAFLRDLRQDDRELQDWFRTAIRARTESLQTEIEERRARMREAQTRAEKDEHSLLQLRLRDVISDDEFCRERDRLRCERVEIAEQLDAESLDHDERCDAALKAVELADRLADTWVKGDPVIRRLILETTAVELVLDDETVAVTARSPFNLLALGREGENGRSERI